MTLTGVVMSHFEHANTTEPTMASNLNLIAFNQLQEHFPALNLRTLRNRLKDDDEFRATTIRLGRWILVDLDALERLLESRRQK